MKTVFELILSPLSLSSYKDLFFPEQVQPHSYNLTISAWEIRYSRKINDARRSDDKGGYLSYPLRFIQLLDFFGFLAFLIQPLYLLFPLFLFLSISNRRPILHEGTIRNPPNLRWSCQVFPVEPAVPPAVAYKPSFETASIQSPPIRAHTHPPCSKPNMSACPPMPQDSDQTPV